MIEWAGIRSDDLGIVVEHYPKPIIPERKQSVQSIEGRSGDILISTTAFKNYTQPYEVFLDVKEKGGLEVVFPKMVDWLMGNEGYQRLEDSYFPDVYRLAYYSGGTDFLSIFNEYGQGTLTFNCDPHKYYKFGEEEIEVPNNSLGRYEFHNPSAFAAEPIIKFTTTTTGTNAYANLNFGGRIVQFSLSDVAIGSEVRIDVKNHTSYINANKVDMINPDSQTSFWIADKWMDFRISGLDGTTYTDTETGLQIEQGHLVQIIIDPSNTQHEDVTYENLDVTGGRLVLKATSFNWSTYGSYEDLLLRKGDTQVSLSGGNNLRVTPRWWTI